MSDTPLDLDALERLCAAATPGPWQAATEIEYPGAEDSGNWFVWNYEVNLSIASQRCVSLHDFEDKHEHVGLTRRDAAFIAAARTALPALVAEVRYLRARVPPRNDPQPYDG